MIFWNAAKLRSRANKYNYRKSDSIRLQLEQIIGQTSALSRSGHYRLEEQVPKYNSDALYSILREQGFDVTKKEGTRPRSITFIISWA